MVIAPFGVGVVSLKTKVSPSQRAWLTPGPSGDSQVSSRPSVTRSNLNSNGLPLIEMLRCTEICGSRCVTRTNPPSTTGATSELSCDASRFSVHSPDKSGLCTSPPSGETIADRGADTRSSRFDGFLHIQSRRPHMHRLVHIAVGTLMLAGVAETAAAATWRLVQPAGETITLTVTNTVIHIVTRDRRIEIPVAQVQSLRITTRYLDPFEKWESWQPEGHDRRAPSPALDAIADNGGEGVILLLGAGALATAGVASVVDPEAIIHITWLDGEVTRSASVRTGFFTPFVERRLRDAGLNSSHSTPSRAASR